MTIKKFINDQLSVWPEVASSFRTLKNAKLKEVEINGLKARLQCNPARIISTTAEIDEATLKARDCFLCENHLPEKQLSMPFEGRKGRKYFIRINPYPIFPEHLVISRSEHVAQSIWQRFVDMLDLAQTYRDFIFFYNGPYSGASAPDHMHFQAAPKGLMPVEVAINDRLKKLPYSSDVGVLKDKFVKANKSLMDEGQENLLKEIEYLTSVQDAHIYHYKKFTKGAFVLRAKTSKSIAKLFYRFLDCVPILEGETEPRFNLFSYYTDGEFRAIVMLRNEIRSHHYFDKGVDHLTISPGCADMLGLFVVPNIDDFQKADERLMTEMMSEVSISEQNEEDIIWRLTRTQPSLDVGIMSGKEINFEIISDGAGPQKVTYRGGKIDYNGALYDELEFDAVTMSTMFAEPSFILYGVTIGVDFHWERKVDQKFAGTLRFIVEDEKIVAVNRIGVEDYLVSVISSEMKASAKLEYLKAHAVISRSWVISQIQSRLNNESLNKEILKGRDLNNASLKGQDLNNEDLSKKEGNSASEHIIWFDHDDHKNFDVCADDHCQRYQGLTMALGENVRKAIDMTWGQVLMSEGKICDARFSKCCGGVMEKFSVCWGDVDYPYLVGKLDSPLGFKLDSKAISRKEKTKEVSHESSQNVDLPDLTIEQNARKWILEEFGIEKDSFCDTKDNNILSQVLNDYDQETKDFFRWKVEYSQEELSELIKKRSGIDFGKIYALIPIARGVSGRLYKMEIVGQKKRMVIGKELIIRKYLSESHLKSSAFIVSYYDKQGNEIPEQKIIELNGAKGNLEGNEDSQGVEIEKFVLTGAGWGHGVGLCQIGAAVMAYEAIPYEEILLHYYPKSHLERISI